MAYYQPSVNYAQIDVDVYEPMSACENLAVLSANTIVPTYLHMLLSCMGIDAAMATQRFRALNFVVSAQPTAQDPTYDDALPFVFCYLTSLIPKNPTDSLQTHLRQKEKGLLTAIENINLLGTPGNYVVPNDALSSLQKFMNEHTDVLKVSFETFLGIHNVNARHIAQSYSHELIANLEYANMNSVMIIEEHIISARHLCLSDTIVQGCLHEYNKFKGRAQFLYGKHWKLVALLDKDLWNDYSRSRAHKRFRIISTIFASEEVNTYDGIMIDGTSIASYKSMPYYARIFNGYRQDRQELVSSGAGLFGQREVALIHNRANRYDLREDINNETSDQEGH